MTILNQIEEYLTSVDESKRADLRTLHCIIQNQHSDAKLWFLDGKNEEGKTVSNPNIGYGFQHLPLSKGKLRPFYQMGISANKSGISIYILGKKDKNYLAEKFGLSLGKVSISGYCIKFKSLKDLNLEVLKEVIQYGLNLDK